jgi:tRNA C32,U32 (ribose-2'-O)-methylase TrmJ
MSSDPWERQGSAWGRQGSGRDSRRVEVVDDLEDALRQVKAIGHTSNRELRPKQHYVGPAESRRLKSRRARERAARKAGRRRER